MKIVKNGKEIVCDLDLSEMKVYTSKYNGSYSSDREYKTTIVIKIPSDKYRTLDRESLLTQLNLYLFSHIGSHLVNVSKCLLDDKKKSSQGFKTVIFEYLYTDSFLANALGVNINDYSGFATFDIRQSTPDQLLSRMEFGRKTILEACQKREELQLECHKIAKIKELDANDVWSENYKDQWMEYCKGLEKHGLSYVWQKDQVDHPKSNSLLN
jgi:hypothetical protein